MKTIASEFHQIPRQTQEVVATCLYGLVASLGAVAFQVVISWIYRFCYVHGTESPHFIWTSLAVICSVSLISGWLLSVYCPEAAGSGIPQLKLAFWKDFGHTPSQIGWVKFIAGALSIGGGLSMGREGPSVQIGGTLSSTVAGWLGVAKQKKRVAVAAGAAAGLAAAFNAPLAGVAFVLEEILEDLNSRMLGPVLLASVVGAFIVHAAIGAQPAFELPRIDEPTWRAYLLMPVVAILATLIGVLFQRVTIGLRGRMKKLRAVPRALHPLMGGIATWGLGVAVFSSTHKLGVFSLGYDDLSAALNGGLAWKIALVLLFAKLAATILSYGCGGCGGIFSPSLFFGGMCGAALAGLGSHFLGISESDRVLLAVGGMSACLGAIVQAPVTAILIIFEMTHQFALLPGLMIAGLVSQVVVRRLSHANFYEAILLQDGHHIESVIPPRDLRSWQNLPISAIANFRPTFAEDLTPGALDALVKSAAYDRFPVLDGVELRGIVTRKEIEEARFESRPVILQPAVTGAPGQSIREAQQLLIESTTGLIVLTDGAGCRPLGIVTLHDLLRAQVSMSERAE